MVSSIDGTKPAADTNGNRPVSERQKKGSEGGDKPSVKLSEQPSKSVETDNVTMDKIAQSVENYLKMNQTDLRVEIDRKTDTAIFKIIRKNDNKVIKEVPPPEMREIAARIEKMAGSLIDSSG